MTVCTKASFFIAKSSPAPAKTTIALRRSCSRWLVVPPWGGKMSRGRLCQISDKGSSAIVALTNDLGRIASYVPWGGKTSSAAT